MKSVHLAVYLSQRHCRRNNTFKDTSFNIQGTMGILKTVHYILCITNSCCVVFGIKFANVKFERQKKINLTNMINPKVLKTYIFIYVIIKIIVKKQHISILSIKSKNKTILKI